MPINGYNPTLNNLLALAAMKAKGIDATTENEKPETRPAEEEANTQNAQATKPAPQKAPATTADIIGRAIERTIEAGSKAGVIFTEELLEQGQEAAQKEEANLTPNQRQNVSLATTASTQAVRQGLSLATATAVAKIIVDEYRDNKNFDNDAVEIAADIVHNFMGGMQA
jgi:hypothetical protein